MVHGSPAADAEALQARQAVDNIVYVTDANKFCMIMPRFPHTNIGDSEHPGGTKTYCSRAGRYSTQQGQLPLDFWSNVEFKHGHSKSGARYAQLTGCIRPEKLSRLNPNDAGGQYDSSGGSGGNGNPAGSVCLGYVPLVLETHADRIATHSDISTTSNSSSLLLDERASNAVTILVIVH
ncbi:hypothetical protein AX17_005527 [Amanita inopinata Kibby_2008]|nr:hypothetical protein AX17_005527 [Amanita inopinata Kibby_2008]